jgi:hypothetical protein
VIRYTPTSRFSARFGARWKDLIPDRLTAGQQTLNL